MSRARPSCWTPPGTPWTWRNDWAVLDSIFMERASTRRGYQSRRNTLSKTRNGQARWKPSGKSLIWGEAAGKVFTIENLNTRVDHPGTPFASSEATAYLVQAVDSPGLKMNFDLYHCQVDEGNLIERTRQVLPWVGEIQVADVPGRREPGTGEINYPGVADALRHMGFSGTIALEAWASEEDSVRALERFREAFSL